MKKRMLVGAAGLALAGVAIAADGLRPAPIDSTTFLNMRDAALGKTGSTARADALRQLRREIELGNIDPRTVLFTITEDLIPGSGQPPANLNLLNGTETAGGAPVFGTDGFGGNFPPANYSNAPTSNVSINGAPNVFGIAVQSDPWIGSATDAIMANNISGPGGTTLTGNIPVPHVLPNGATQFEPYGALARRTGADNLTTAFALGMNFRFPLISPGAGSANHARISTDWYLIDQDTSQWWSPVSFTEGFVSDRMFFGGTKIGGVLGFAEDAGGFLTNFVSLGNLPGNFQIGQFYAPPRNPTVFPFPVGEWFQIMAVMVSTPGGGFGQAIFIKTPGTIAAGVMDPRMVAGPDAIIPTDKDPAGWLNTYPGIADNAGTMGTVEGIGQALTQFGVQAPTTGAFGLGPLLAAATLSGVQFGEGLDPPASVEPNFQWDDAFIDNFRAAGQAAALPALLPDFINPYTEDMESYFPNAAIRFQTDRIFDANSSNATVFTGLTAFGQSLANQNLNSDGLFRQEDNSAVPTTPVRARGKVGDPVIVEVKTFNIPVSGNPSSGRAIRVSDGLETGALTSVILGGLDPTVPSIDANIWIRQPNTTAAIPGNPTPFDPNQDADDNLRQVNAIPTANWANQNLVPPGPLNFAFENVNTNIAVPVNTPAIVRMEIEPNPAQDPNQFNDEGLVSITVGGTPIPGPQSGSRWIAGGTSVSTIQVWSGNQSLGNGEVFAVDDFKLAGGAFFEAQGGTPFSLPFTEDFDSYDAGFTVDEAGATPFRNLASTPDQAVDDTARQLTLADGASAPATGEMVCLYVVDSAPLADPLGLNIQAGDAFAVSLDALPPVFNTFVAANNDCPGAGPTPPPDPLSPPGTPQASDFVVRSATALDPVTGTVLTENTPRLAEGQWRLQNLNNAPVAFDPVMGSTNGVAHSSARTDLAYSFYTASRWEGNGTQTIVSADPTVGPLGTPGTPGNQVLEVVSADVDGSVNDFVMFGQVSSILPDGIASGATGSVDLTSRVYIESLDAGGLAINAAPRSRMEIVVLGATADGGRIVNIMLGGPNVNKRATLQALPTPPPTSGPGGTEPDDRIWVTEPSAAGDPDFQYLPTPITLLSGGTGLDGTLSGPMVNTWITVRTRIFGNDTWEVAIDEGAGFVTIASGTALDAGAPGQAGGIANTSGAGSFNINIGNDFGSGGTPVPNPFRIHAFHDPSVDGITEDADGDGNFDNVNEDGNANGVLDPGEDLDGDGALDLGIEDLDGDGVFDTNVGAGRSFDSVAPAGLSVDADPFSDPDDDYCYYETTLVESEDPDFFDKAFTFDVDPVTGAITPAFGANPRPISQNNDTIAVINRPIDPGVDGIEGTPDDFVVPGSAKIHDPCPINVSIPINQFELFKGDGTATLSFAGRWALDGQAGQAGTNNPNPPGGVNRPNGPRVSLLSYNDPSVVSPDFPGGPRRIGILLAQWGDGVTMGDTGVDTVGTAFPPQRWFFDDVSISVNPPCPEDLNGDGVVNGTDIGFILNKFNNVAAGDPEDFNGDGAINGGDITAILNAFGPCP